MQLKRASSEAGLYNAQVAIDKGLFRTAPNPKAAPCMDTILRTALELAEGLAFLHSRCVVHCDLSGGTHSYPSSVVLAVELPKVGWQSPQ